MPDQANINFYPFSDGAVLHRVGTHKIWVFNHSSAVLWCLYEEYGEGEGLVQAYAEHFHISLQQARVDIEQTLDQFGRTGIGVEGLRAQGEGLRDCALESVTRDVERGTRKAVTSDQGLETSHKSQAISLFDQTYCLAGVSWRISYDDAGLADGWVACLKHLQAEAGDVDLSYTLLQREDGWVVASLKDELAGLADDEVLPALLAILFADLCASLPQYLLLHAAAALKNDRLVLFPGESTFGKSTLSAALAASGWSLFSDELAPLDTESMGIVPFVYPVGIKSRSLPALKTFYPDLERQSGFRRLDGQVVRYLSSPQIHLAGVSTLPKPVSVLIFPRYVPGTETSLQKLSPLQALELLADTGSSERPLEVEDVKALLALAEGKPCWGLTYSDLGGAVKAVHSVV